MIRIVLKFFRSKAISYNKIQKAYVLENLPYLKKAYSWGTPFHKNLVVRNLGNIKRQEVFDFLFFELQEVEDQRLRHNIYESLISIASNKNIMVLEEVDTYLKVVQSQLSK